MHGGSSHLPLLLSSLPPRNTYICLVTGVKQAVGRLLPPSAALPARSLAAAHHIMLASAATDVVLWEPCRDEPVHQLSSAHGAPVTSLRWTSNDRVLGSGSHDGTVVLTESDGNVFDTLRPTITNEPTGVLPMLALSWSPGSRYLAAGANDASVRVFDLQRRVHALTLRGHRAAVTAVAWNPNEMHLASASSAATSSCTACRAPSPPSAGRRTRPGPTTSSRRACAACSGRRSSRPSWRARARTVRSRCGTWRSRSRPRRRCCA